MKNIKKAIESTNWRTVPIELYAFIIYGIIMNFIQFIVYFFGSKEIYEGLIPITGWGLNNSIDFVTIFFALIICVQKNIRLRNIILVLLGINISFGFIDFIIPWGDDFGNSYLIRSNFRLIWTMVIPALWIIVLLSPRIKRYCQKT